MALRGQSSRKLSILVTRAEFIKEASNTILCVCVCVSVCVVISLRAWMSKAAKWSEHKLLIAGFSIDRTIELCLKYKSIKSMSNTYGRHYLTGNTTKWVLAINIEIS